MLCKHIPSEQMAFCFLSSEIWFLLQFFEMPRHEAVKALDVYKRAGQQVMICIHFDFVYKLIKFFGLVVNWFTSTSVIDDLRSSFDFYCSVNHILFFAAGCRSL